MVNDIDLKNKRPRFCWSWANWIERWLEYLRKRRHTQVMEQTADEQLGRKVTYVMLLLAVVHSLTPFQHVFWKFMDLELEDGEATRRPIRCISRCRLQHYKLLPMSTYHSWMVKDILTWHCLWSQHLIHVKSQAKMSVESRLDTMSTSTWCAHGKCMYSPLR